MRKINVFPNKFHLELYSRTNSGPVLQVSGKGVNHDLAPKGPQGETSRFSIEPN